MKDVFYAKIGVILKKNHQPISSCSGLYPSLQLFGHFPISPVGPHPVASTLVDLVATYVVTGKLSRMWQACTALLPWNSTEDKPLTAGHGQSTIIQFNESLFHPFNLERLHFIRLIKKWLGFSFLISNVTFLRWMKNHLPPKTTHLGYNWYLFQIGKSVIKLTSCIFLWQNNEHQIVAIIFKYFFRIISAKVSLNPLEGDFWETKEFTDSKNAF